ncbi:MAG: DUF1993 domain-containing protein [Pseudomonadota bacterium]
MTLTPSAVARAAAAQMYRGLDKVLEKAAAHCKARDIEESVFLNWRLAPDMFPLVRQVQIATDFPARGLSRLAGADLPSMPDEETSFAELRERIKKAREHIDALSDEAINADPDQPITVPAGKEEMTFPRLAFLQHFVLPNLYFHVTTAYAILRSLGVEIGKRDFLAAPK